MRGRPSLKTGTKLLPLHSVGQSKSQPAWLQEVEKQIPPLYERSQHTSKDHAYKEVYNGGHFHKQPATITYTVQTENYKNGK